MAKRRAKTKRFLTGDKELDAIFSSLSDSKTNQLGRPALSAAARNTAKAMKKLVPVDEGHLKKSIGSTGAKRGKKSGALVAKAGARSDDKFTFTDEDGNRKVPWRYSHLVNNGTSDTPASRFMDKAARQTESENKTIIANKIKETLEKKIKKAKQKGKEFF